MTSIPLSQVQFVNTFNYQRDPISFCSKDSHLSGANRFDAVFDPDRDVVVLTEKKSKQIVLVPITNVSSMIEAEAEAKPVAKVGGVK